MRYGCPRGRPKVVIHRRRVGLTKRQRRIQEAERSAPRSDTGSASFLITSASVFEYSSSWTSSPIDLPTETQAPPDNSSLPKHHHHPSPTPPTPLSQPFSHITSHIKSHSASLKRKNCFQAARPPGPTTPGAPVRRAPIGILRLIYPYKKSPNPTTPKKSHTRTQPMPRRTTSPRERGQCPPEHGQRPRRGQRAPDTATRRNKKANAPAPATPPMLVPISIQKTNTCRSPLVCPGKEEEKKTRARNFNGTPATEKSIPRANQTETKPGRATGPKAIPQNNKKLLVVSHPSIHPSIHATREGKTQPPLTAHPARNPPSTPHSTTWPRSCSSAASAASGRTTPPS